MLPTRITWKVGLKYTFEGIRVAKVNRVKIFKGSSIVWDVVKVIVYTEL